MRRVLLYDAHQLRNYKSQTSVAVSKLSVLSRWALTGISVHNKELDMHALLKFLRCKPFDDIKVWKIWVSDNECRWTRTFSYRPLRRTKAVLRKKESKKICCCTTKLTGGL